MMYKSNRGLKVFLAPYDNPELIKKYLNTKGYFYNYPTNFPLRYEDASYGVLLDYYITENDKMKIYHNGSDDKYYAFFIPEKEIEFAKNPFSEKEFSELFNLGDIIVFRDVNNHRTFKALVTLVSDNKVCFGGFTYTYKELANNFEFFVDNKWKSFYNIYVF